MKKFNEIFLEFRNEEWAKHEPYSHLFREIINGRAHERAAKEYARQCCEDVLNRAAENAEVDYTNNDGGGYVRNYHVDKESITSTQIVLP